MNVFSSFATSASALTAEKLRIDVIASNLANQNTTRTQNGEGPYRPRRVVFQEILDNQVNGSGLGRGVQVQRIETPDRAPRLVYQPDHPDADVDGYVAMPDIDVAAEMVDLISATRAYEANVTVLNATKTIYLRSLEIGR